MNAMIPPDLDATLFLSDVARCKQGAIAFAFLFDFNQFDGRLPRCSVVRKLVVDEPLIRHYTDHK